MEEGHGPPHLKRTFSEGVPINQMGRTVVPAPKGMTGWPFCPDSPALLAIVFKEPGADVVVEALKARTQMTRVNAAEVALPSPRGSTVFGVKTLFMKLPVSVLPFELNSAMVCGPSRRVTDHFGLNIEAVPVSPRNIGKPARL